MSLLKRVLSYTVAKTPFLEVANYVCTDEQLRSWPLREREFGLEDLFFILYT